MNIIGLIPNSPEIEENGDQVSETTYADGWHVNSIEPLKGCEKYLVTPKTPYNKFYGVDSCYMYTFGSKEQFEELFPRPDESQLETE